MQKLAIKVFSSLTFNIFLFLLSFLVFLSDSLSKLPTTCGFADQMSKHISELKIKLIFFLMLVLYTAPKKSHLICLHILKSYKAK